MKKYYRMQKFLKLNYPTENPYISGFVGKEWSDLSTAVFCFKNSDEDVQFDIYILNEEEQYQEECACLLIIRDTFINILNALPEAKEYYQELCESRKKINTIQDYYSEEKNWKIFFQERKFLLPVSYENSSFIQAVVKVDSVRKIYKCQINLYNNYNECTFDFELDDQKYKNSIYNLKLIVEELNKFISAVNQFREDYIQEEKERKPSEE